MAATATPPASADDQPPGVPNRCRLRKRRNLGVRNANSIRKRIGEAAKTRAQYKRNLRTERRARKHELRSRVGESELVSHDYKSSSARYLP